MDNRQTFIPADKGELLSKTGEMKNNGYFLSQISVTNTKTDGFDLLYSFEKNEENYEMINLRVKAGEDDEIESVSGIFPYAYLYENEMKDLFGIKIANLNVDFKGNLYKTTIKTPFNSKSEE